MKTVIGGINPSIIDDPISRRYWEIVKTAFNEISSIGNVINNINYPGSSSGDALGDYLFKPGLPGGQTAYGGTGPGEDLVLSGTTISDGTNAGTVIVRNIPNQNITSIPPFMVQDSDAATRLFEIGPTGNTAAQGWILAGLGTNNITLDPSVFSVPRVTFSGTSTEGGVMVSSGTPFYIGDDSTVSTSRWMKVQGGELALNFSGTGTATFVPLTTYASVGQTGNLAAWRSAISAGATLYSRITNLGVWDGPISTTSAVTVTDSVFSIVDDGTPTKIAQFQLDGLTVGTHTYRPPPTAAASTDTLAALGLAQTFTKTQTITPDNPNNSNLVLTNVSNGVAAPMFDTQITDAGHTGVDGIWNMNATLSNPGANITVSTTLVDLVATMSDLDSVIVTGQDVTIDGSQSATSTGGPQLWGQNFVVTASGTSGSSFPWGTLIGIRGSVVNSSTDGMLSMRGIVMSATTSTGCTTDLQESCLVTNFVSGTGVATLVRAFSINAPSGSGSITTYTALNIQPYVFAPTVSTAIGIFIGNFTKGSTNWSMTIGQSSSCAPSYHWGKFFFGNSTTPTARVHIEGSTTAAGSAPIKLTSGTLMTTPEAGAMEYTNQTLYFTGSARDVVVMAGQVLTYDGDVLTYDDDLVVV